MSSVKNFLKTKSSDLWSIHPGATVFEALELMAEKNIGALLVLEGEKLVGIFSERDYARKVVLLGKSSKEIPVSDLMTTKVYFISPDKTLDDCMVLMSMKRIRHLPVMERGKLHGIVTIGDVVQHLIKEKEDRIRELEKDVYGGGLKGEYWKAKYGPRED